MYFTFEMIRAAQERYGEPVLLRLNYPTPRATLRFHPFDPAGRPRPRCHPLFVSSGPPGGDTQPPYRKAPIVRRPAGYISAKASKKARGGRPMRSWDWKSS